jgi:acetyltransferase-like isoleucine patch superfamily enzyme
MKQTIRSLIRRGISTLYAEMRRQHTMAQRLGDFESGRLSFGKHTYGAPEIHHYRGNETSVRIGNYCSIAPGVVFITGGIHPLDWVSTYPFRARWGLPGGHQDGNPSTKGDIRVGSDVWIGTDAMILSGVTIGDGAAIAARSVVTRDIPPYAIAAGVPAKVIRSRFDEKTVRSLLEIQWWDWPDDQVHEAVPLLSGANMEAFLEHCRGRFNMKERANETRAPAPATPLGTAPRTEA